MMNAIGILGLLILPTSPLDDLPAAGTEERDASEEAVESTPVSLWPVVPPQETYPRETYRPGASTSQAKGAPVIDFGRLELEARIGLLFYSEDFEADPSFSGGLFARVPLTFLSPKASRTADYFGLRAEVLFSTVERDIDPPVGPDDDGLVLVAGLGVDFNFIRDKAWRIRAQAGLQYWHFGDVSELDDGLAFGAGLDGGVGLGKNFWITLSPSVGFGHAGDWITFVEFGFQYRF